MRGGHSPPDSTGLVNIVKAVWLLWTEEWSSCIYDSFVVHHLLLTIPTSLPYLRIRGQMRGEGGRDEEMRLAWCPLDANELNGRSQRARLELFDWEMKCFVAGWCGSAGIRTRTRTRRRMKSRRRHDDDDGNENDIKLLFFLCLNRAMKNHHWIVICVVVGRRRYGARRMNVIESWAVTHTRIWTSGNRVGSVSSSEFLQSAWLSFSTNTHQRRRRRWW